jgi:hypothetical protein
MNPFYYNNRNLDFNALSPREFEEIVYGYFKKQIEDNIFIGIYDEVVLSSGSADRGVDISLYMEQKIVGVIQCKNYGKNYPHTDVLEELIKFLLHHLKECKEKESSSSSLIHDIENFTYFFVVAKGFTDKASTLIASFNETWKEQDLDKVLQKVFSNNKNKLLTSLNTADIKHDLEPLLNQIKVKGLTRVDIDLIIRRDFNLMNRYFSSPFQNQKEDKASNPTSTPSLSQEILDQKTKAISGSIKQVDTKLKSYGEIPRQEVDEILNWINTPRTKEEENIAVISGDAGMGKTVVVAQLYERLKKKEIPVVCFKADYLSFESSIEFEEEFKLTVSLEELIIQYVGESNVGVILIDQIDALSQTLSSNLKPLKVYNNLISNLLRNPRLRVIISCRIYDLKYDPIIATYKKKKEFKLQELNQELVLEVLTVVEIERRSISNSLLKLLQVPLHLATFLNVYSPDLGFNRVQTVQNLYYILWESKIDDNRSPNKPSIDFRRVEQLVFKIADKMYQDQKITVNSIHFDRSSKEWRYLKSEGITKGERKIEFFHQSFFDYAFARQFIAQGKNLYDEIKTKHQGLFIRSMVKQILNFLRGYDLNLYLREIEKFVLSKNEIRFHLKLLCLQQFAFQSDLEGYEVDFVIKNIWNNPELKEIFLTLLFGKGWFKFFVDRHLLRKEIEEGITEDDLVIRNLFRQFLDHDLEAYVDFLHQNKDVQGIEILIIDTWWRVKDINTQKMLEIAEFVFDKEDAWGNNTYISFLLLEKAATTYPDWVINKLKSFVEIKSFEEEPNEQLYFPGEKPDTSVYKVLWEKHPRKAYLLVKSIIQEIVQKRIYPKSLAYHVYVNQAYYSYDRKNLDSPSKYHHAQLDQLQTYIETECESDFDFFQKEVQSYIQSPNLTELIIALEVVRRHPSLFWQEFLELFSLTDKLKQLFSLGQYPKYLVCKALGACYPYFDKETSGQVDEIIMNFAIESEVKVRDYGNGKKIRSKFYGRSKYQLLTELPPLDREKNIRLQKLYLELKRKFGEIENKEPQGVVVYRGDRNALNEDTYDKMSNEHWKKSFRTYSLQNPEYDSFKKPDATSHGRKFKECVANDIDRFTSFVEELITDTEIPNRYKVFGLEGLASGNLEEEQFFRLFKQATAHRDNNFNDYELKDLIYLSDYLNTYSKAEEYIKAFLKKLVIKGSEAKQPITDDYSAGLNSVRGAAVYRAMDFASHPYHYQFVTEVLDHIINSKASSATRACAIQKLGNLWNVVDDRKILVEYFCKLNYDYRPELIRISNQILYHLIDVDFDALKPFIKRAMFVEDTHETIGPALVKAYCYSMEGAENLLEDFYTISNQCIKAAVEFAFEFIKYDHQAEKALQIIRRFLNSKDEKIAQSYTLIFYNLKPKSFEKLYAYFKEYTTSNVGQYIDYSFYKYLGKCAYEFPNECIELTANFPNHLGPDLSRRLLKEEPLKVLITAYNAIRDYRHDDPALEKAMNTFDALLEDKNYRKLAFEVLEDVDLY